LKSAHLLFNPASGSFSAARADQVRQLLRDAGIACQPLFPDSAAEAEASVRDISLSTDEPLIIAVGGDGTVNTVLNGIANQRAILGYIPLGTANVLARELGITSCAAAVARINNGAARPVTAGRITGTAAERYFLLMAGTGFDGAVVADVRPGEKRFLGKGAYLLAALRRLRHWDFTPLSVSIGSERLSCHTVIACNAAYYGGNFRLAPGASIFSSALQVVGVAGCCRKDIAVWALQVIFPGTKIDGERIWTRQASQLEITGSKAVQADGDKAGTAPLTITALPEFVRVIV
jgi:YegS/Rv2252/BmrU family lipid kinase